MIFHTDITVKDCLDQLQTHFNAAGLYYGHGTDNSWDEACWLLETVMRRHNVEELSEETVLGKDQLKDIADIADRRIESRQPLAYLLNEAWFAGYPFYVDERVLVPRSPLAEPIQHGFEPLLKKDPRTILDICTGSGCIGIACAMAFPEADVDLSDLSSDALMVADKNIKKYELNHRLKTIQSNLFEDISSSYDLIISNPPYVSQAEYDELPQEYLNEPEMGLVSEDNGLAIPAEIILNAEKYLNDDGILILEVGKSWQALAEALPQYPFLWLDFEFGGEGVCLLTVEEIRAGIRHSALDRV